MNLDFTFFKQRRNSGERKIGSNLVRYGGIDKGVYLI